MNRNRCYLLIVLLVTMWSGSVIAAINENYYFSLVNTYSVYENKIYNSYDCQSPDNSSIVRGIMKVV